MDGNVCMSCIDLFWWIAGGRRPVWIPLPPPPKPPFPPSLQCWMSRAIGMSGTLRKSKACLGKYCNFSGALEKFFPVSNCPLKFKAVALLVWISFCVQIDVCAWDSGGYQKEEWSASYLLLPVPCAVTLNLIVVHCVKYTTELSFFNLM